MYFKSSLITCPYLRGGDEGAKCCVEDKFIRDIEKVEIWFCMNKHFETCRIYMLTLREMALKAIENNTVLMQKANLNCDAVEVL